MKHKIIKISIFILLLTILLPSQIFAIRSSGGYIIESYNIDMKVNEDNTFDITETIAVNFTGYGKHGIYRKIPLKNTVERLDGTKSSNRAQISNIQVSESYTTSNENGYKVIKIGNANKTVTGKQIYTISYTYNIGKDPLKDADELYFNLIGTEWDTSINNVNFTITMPKEFDKSLLGFSSGDTGTTNSSNVSYSVDGKVIRGSLKNTLSSGQALTVRLSLPEGYFVGASLNLDIYYIAVIIFCLICVLIADRLWAKYGKDDKIIETVEFYPPEGYNSAEIGFLYNGITDSKSVISLLIYLANKGYLKIEETEEYEYNYKKRPDDKNKIIKIIKLKEYDGDNDNEREFLNGLFAKSGKILEKASNIEIQEKLNGNEITWEEAKKKAKEDTRTYVTNLELKSGFSSTVSNIESNIEKEFKDKIMDKSTKGKRKWLIFMSIAIFLLITIKPILEYSNLDMKYLNGTLAIGRFLLLYYVAVNIILGKNEKNNKTHLASLDDTSWSIIFHILYNSMLITK